MEDVRGLIKAVKNNIDANQVRDNIRGVRKTKDGALLITLKNEGDTMQIIEGQISKNLKGMEMRRSGGKARGTTMFHLQNLEELTTKEEIEGALCNRGGDERN